MTKLPPGTRIRLINHPPEFEGKVGTILDEPLVWGENQYFLLDEPVYNKRRWHSPVSSMQVLGPPSYQVHDEKFTDVDEAIAYATARATELGKPVRIETYAP